MTTQAQPLWKTDPTHTFVEFTCYHMGLSLVRGVFKKFEVNVQFDDAHPEHTTLSASIDASSVDTRIQQIDDALRGEGFFEAAKFPSVTFKSTRVTVAHKDHYRLHGDLTIRDVTRPVVLDVALRGPEKDGRNNTKYGFTATTKIDRWDYGMTWNRLTPSGLPITAHDVAITIEGEVLRPPPVS